MDLLAELNAARERITILEGSISTLTGERDTHAATVASNQVELANLGAERTQLTSDLAAVRAELATANTNLEQANVTLTERATRITELETSASTAEQQVLERLGRGGKPARIKAGADGGAPKTAAEVMSAYNALTDPTERATFYEAHKATLFPPRTR